MKAMNLKMKSRRPYLGTIGSLVFMLKLDMVIEVNSFCPRVVPSKFDILTNSSCLGVKFTFKNINVNNPNEEFCFTIRHADDMYTCEDNIWFGL